MALNPAVSIGCSWPPLGIEVLDIWELPFLNTVILLSSGVSVTLAHRAITMPLSFEKKISNPSKLDINPLEFNLNSDVVNLDSKYKNITTFALSLTVLYGFIFTGIQWYEYENAPFALNDSVYGSLFFILTGFHGFHVCIGILFLLVCLLRNIKDHFSPRHHIGFICAA
jgi:heme/copper-type cytochrome/quinol oxidase subunit 3